MHQFSPTDKDGFRIAMFKSTQIQQQKFLLQIKIFPKMLVQL